LDAVNPFLTGTASLAATVDGRPWPVEVAGATAGLDTTGSDGPQAGVNVVVRLTDGRYAAAVLRLPPAHFAPHAGLPFDLTTASGFLFILDSASPTVVGLIGPGTLHLAVAGTTPGAPVRGDFAAELLASPF
jgi:hypothetical protein